ncbi:hypothetical protein [Microbacterium sp.]|uniref:hypothetical protein n=1 Tax=Microbacterium sp. TaxID=51671 RepID=UPI0039E3B694
MNTLQNTTDTEPDTIVVDARFAGGALIVTATTLPHDDSIESVRLTGPGFDLALFPHEAAALAAALGRATRTAARRARQLRRPVDVDAQLRELEG